MILLTRLNGSTFAVNPDLVERIQESPDTTIVLVDGTTFIVTESVDDIIEEIAEYRARVIAHGQEQPDLVQADRQPLAERGHGRGQQGGHALRAQGQAHVGRADHLLGQRAGVVDLDLASRPVQSTPPLSGDVAQNVPKIRKARCAR